MWWDLRIGEKLGEQLSDRLFAIPIRGGIFICPREGEYLRLYFVDEEMEKTKTL